MSADQQKAAHAAYMREYTQRNRDKINAARRRRHAADPSKKVAVDARYYAGLPPSTVEERAAAAAHTREYRARHPDRAKASKQRYYASEKGHAQKKKEDAAFVLSGGRAKAEARRAAKPISAARKACRVRWAKDNVSWYTAAAAARRGCTQELSSDDFWILQEAVNLARLRERVVGGCWHVDHILAVSKGGDSTPENLQVVPAAWNRRKSNVRTERFFGAK